MRKCRTPSVSQWFQTPCTFATINLQNVLPNITWVFTRYVLLHIFCLKILMYLSTKTGAYENNWNNSSYANLLTIDILLHAQLDIHNIW